MQAKHFNWSLGLWLAALFLTILGAKLWVIQLYGTNLPYWDQWDQARYFFQPLVEGKLIWSGWFQPHNEHRIVFTRLLDALELWLNGQWDPRLQMVVNAMIHAGYACTLAVGLWWYSGKKQPGRICGLLAPLFALPLAPENTIHGFQSQMYFLGIFSLAAMLGLGLGRVGGWAWWLGALTAGLAIFTMASGFLAVVAVVGLIAARSLQQRRWPRKELITVAVAVAVAALGWALNVTVKEHQLLQAKSAGVFLWVFEASLAWPFTDLPWLCPLLCLPLAWLVFEYFRGTLKDARAGEFVLLLAGWSILQVAALAYSRASVAGSNRYFDTLSSVPLVNLAALLVLRENGTFARLAAAWRQGLALTGAGLLLFGLWQVAAAAVTDYLPKSRALGLIEEENLRAFVQTDDPQALGNPALRAVTFPFTNPIVQLMRNPTFAAILPAEGRRPLPLENAAPTQTTFVRDGFAPEKPKQTFTATWGSFTTDGAAATGNFLSAPMQARLPRLLLPICTGDDLRGLQLNVVAADGRKTALPIRQAGRWHTLIFTPPASRFRLEMVDASRESWIAAGEMKEAGRGSVAARWLTQVAVPILLVGLAGFLWLTGKTLGGQKKEWLEALMGLGLAGGVIWIACARQANAPAQAAKLEKSWAIQALKAGEGALAARHLREALWIEPNDPKTLCELAALMLEKPEMAGPEKPAAEAQKLAAAYYHAALKLQPHFAAAEAGLRRIAAEN